jgi:YegS/Rv2252/BmrU family lipid kinase
VGDPLNLTGMRKAALLYNARSGGRRAERESDLREALEILTGAGVEAGIIVTQSSADAAEQARKAIAEGCDTVFACGGDGTIHDVLQGLAGTRVALAVVPMGTANALAHDLGLPLEPAKAVRAVIDGEHRRVALGRLRVLGLDGKPVILYFTVAVGIGVDAHLFYKLHSGMKQHMGMAAYYAKAWHLWFTHRMERFSVACSNGGIAQFSHGNVTEMLAVRIRNFGGVVRELAPGASLDRNDLRVVVSRTSSRFTYLLYVTRGLLGATFRVPGVELVHSDHVKCDYVSKAAPASKEAEGVNPSTRVYVEADGELVGTLPAEITIVPDAVTLLVPRRVRK